MRVVVLSFLAALMATPAICETSAASPPQTANVVVDDGGEDIPRGAPSDDYGFTAWCYGALDESLGVYETIKPDLKAIDALFGSPVQEDVPYARDVAAERLALKRFAAAMAAAERASPSIAPAGAAAQAKGRMIWAKAEQMPSREQADTWLYWGVPNRCETAARTLKARAMRPDQAAALAAEAAQDVSPVDDRMAEQAALTPPPETTLAVRRPRRPLADPPEAPIPPANPDAPMASAGGAGADRP